MLALSLPSRNERLNHVYVASQVISSNLVIIAAFGGSIPLLGFLRPVFMFNSYLFYLLLLGMNVLLLFKKKGEISFEMFLTLSLCCGTFMMYAVGPTFHLFKPPLYSEITVVIIGVLNLAILIVNLSKEHRVSIVLDSDTKLLLVMFAGSLVVKFLLLGVINDADAYLDDGALFDNAINFCEDGGAMFDTMELSYYGRKIEYGFEIVYSTSLGIVAKSGLHGSVLVSKIFVKTYLTTLGSFVIFPAHAYLSRMIKARNARFIILAIIICNQWFFLEGPYLLTGIPFTFYFITGLYYFIRLLENEGSPAENVIFAIISGAVAFGTRYNGLVLFAMQGVILFLIYLIPKIQSSSLTSRQPFKWISRISLPKISRIWLYLISIVGLYILFSGIYQAVYYSRNGITMFDFALHARFGYFGEGNSGQFTPVDNFTFTWLWERFSYNAPWYVINFTQFIGYIHLIDGDNALRMMLNYPVSIVCVVIIGLSLIYHWYATAKRNLLSAFYQFVVFAITLASIILWGETYFQFYRWSESLLIMFFSPIYPTFKALLGKVSTAFKREFNSDRVVLIVLLTFLGLVLYGSIGFLFLMFSRSDPILNIIVWQFYGF